MKTIRRLYFYAIAFVAVEVIVWGLINLLRETLAQGVYPSADALAMGLALVLIGVPIFLFHWMFAQRFAAQDDEERSSAIRAIFLYGILIATLVPVAQNIFGLVDRLMLTIFQIDTAYALAGYDQNWIDNLIAIFLNGFAAWYFYRTATTDWSAIKETDAFSDIRRLYRFLWVLYGLGLLIFGVQQILYFVLSPAQADVIGYVPQRPFVNGLALILIGAPLWAYCWMLAQNALSVVEEQQSNMRLGLLYLLSLTGAITVLSTSGVIAQAILEVLFGSGDSFSEFLLHVSGFASVAIPFGAVWAYYGRWLKIEMEGKGSRSAGLKRLYFYVLSLLGLGTVFIGLAVLIDFLIDMIVGATLFPDLRSQLTGSIAAILIGLPLWLMTWRPMQTDALDQGDESDHARRSIVRKSYLYLVIFISVIGAMVSAVGLIYMLLFALLQGEAIDMRETLNALQMVILFALLLAYHFNCLRTDGGKAGDSLAAKRSQYPILIFNAGGSITAQITRLIEKQAPGVPIAAQSITDAIPLGVKDSVKAVVIPSSLAVDPSEAIRLWLKEFSGEKIVVTDEASTWHWSGVDPRHSLNQAAVIIRQLAEGQDVRAAPQSGAFMIAVYIFAALFGFQLLFILLALGISIIAGG
jgi:hypothetical protein